MKLSKITVIAASFSALVTPVAFAQTPTKKLSVVLDAGHGGADTGLNTYGIAEKDLDLALALKVRTELEKQGVEVTMTRTKDETMNLQSRMQLANKAQPGCFVSIHSDDAKQKKPVVVTYYSSSSKLLAFHTQLLLNHVLLPASAKYKVRQDIVSQPFYVLRKSEAPAVMVTANRKLLLAPEQQQKFALALATGVRAYLLSKGSSSAPALQSKPEAGTNDTSPMLRKPDGSYSYLSAK